jgi:hypothetical protein
VSTTEHEAPREQQLPSATESAAPPVGEEIHLPGPSVLPLVTAVGITLAVIGTTIDWKIWSTMGVVITVVCIILWVRDTRRDVASLPEEHHH